MQNVVSMRLTKDERRQARDFAKKRFQTKTSKFIAFVNDCKNTLILKKNEGVKDFFVVIPQENTLPFEDYNTIIEIFLQKLFQYFGFSIKIRQSHDKKWSLACWPIKNPES